MPELIKVLWDCRKCEKYEICRVSVKDGPYDPIKDGCLYKEE